MFRNSQSKRRIILCLKQNGKVINYYFANLFIGDRLKRRHRKKISSTLTINVPVILINKSKLFEMLIEKISLKDELMLSSLTLCG